MQDFGIPLLFGVIPIVILLAITMALSVLSLKSIRFRNLICGRPSVIMEHGSILQAALAKNQLYSGRAAGGTAAPRDHRPVYC